MHQAESTSPTLVPQLRLFRVDASSESDDGCDVPSPAWTLTRFYRDYYRPVLESQFSPLTLKEKSTAIKRWGELTGDPAMETIDTRTCAAFLKAALKYPGMKRGAVVSVNTVVKWVTYIETVMKFAGPESADNKGAALPEGLFGLDSRGWPRPVPWFKKPHRTETQQFVAITLAQLRLFIEQGAPQARFPELPGVTPPQWWERLYRVLHNTDLRIKTAVQLRRSWMRQADGAAWLKIPAAAYKQKREGKVIPLNSAALEVIASMPPGDEVFGWPPDKMAILHAERRRLLAAAGLPANLGFHAVRRGGGTWLFAQCPEAAQVQLGHGDVKTTRDYYADPDSHGPAAVAIVRPYMEHLPQP